MPEPRIVLIHAVTVAIEPIATAFAERWPEADVVNLLEDSLSRDRATEAELTPAMFARFATLTRYSVDIGAGAILFTCSAFGEAIEAARADADVPVLKPNEAMEALQAGDVDGHNHLLADAAPRLAGCDALLLAHSSTSRAREAVSAVVDCPVLTAPGSAVDKLRVQVAHA